MGEQYSALPVAIKNRLKPVNPQRSGTRQRTSQEHSYLSMKVMKRKMKNVITFEKLN
jgi:hypothetical protein